MKSLKSIKSKVPEMIPIEQKRVLSQVITPMKRMETSALPGESPNQSLKNFIWGFWLAFESPLM